MSKINTTKKVAAKAKNMKENAEKSFAEKKAEENKAQKTPGKRGRAQRIPWHLVKPVLGTNTDSEIRSALETNGIPATQPAIFGFRRKTVDADLASGGDGSSFKVQKWLPRDESRVVTLTKLFGEELKAIRAKAKEEAKTAKVAEKTQPKVKPQPKSKGKAKVQPKATVSTVEEYDSSKDETAIS